MPAFICGSNLLRVFCPRIGWCFDAASALDAQRSIVSGRRRAISLATGSAERRAFDPPAQPAQ
jgi:hypothetical protein